MTDRRLSGPSSESAADRVAARILQELAARRRTVTRRGLLRTAGGSALALTAPGVLAACGTEGTVQSEESCTSDDLSATEKTLAFSNWPLYIDQKGKRLPTLEAFEKRTGIDVSYATDVNDNNQFFAKVRNQLGACESTGRDLFVLSEWTAGRMIELGWIQELDHANLANVDANLIGQLREPAWDPGRKFSVPWQSGLTGIAYNAKYTGEVASFEELVTRPDLKGKIALLTEMEDTMAFCLRLVDADPDDFTDDQWDAAIDRLTEIVASGQVRSFTGNEYARPLNKGDLAACLAWSGDVIAMQFDNPDIRFVQPTEGVSLWSDSMLVPNKAAHKTNAEALMDYYYEPEIAARLVAWVNYICPVAGAEEAMERVDDSLVGNPLIFPTDEVWASAFNFMPTDTATRTRFDKDFNQTIGA